MPYRDNNPLHDQPQIDAEPEVVDIRPTPDAYRAALKLIIRDGSSATDRAWATEELTRVADVKSWGSYHGG